MISLQFLAQSLLEISYSNLPHLRIASWDSSSEEKSKLDPGVRKKAPFQGVKMAKKGCHSLFRPVHMYKKYILKKNWVKTAIPALSSGRNNLPPPIWCCHRQLDDQHRNPNMNKVAALLDYAPEAWLGASANISNLRTLVAKVRKCNSQHFDDISA